jgi:hypothetical protein
MFNKEMEKKMKKKISNNLFLLAMCMQYGAGTVVAEQGTTAFTTIESDKKDLSRRMMRLEDKLSELTEKSLYDLEEELDDIADVFEDAREASFKAKSLAAKRKYIRNNLRDFSKGLSRVELSEKDKSKISHHLDKMEKTVARPRVDSKSKTKRK